MFKKLLLSMLLCSALSFQAFALNNEETYPYQNLLLNEDTDVDRVVLGEKIKNLALNMHFSEKTTIGKVMDYSEFRSFKDLLFPIKKKSDLELPLEDLYKLMPLHHNVSAYETVECVEYLADIADFGQKVFYKIYPHNDNNNIGVFYFRGKADAPFAVIVSGGFGYQSIMHEGFPLALELSKQGYNAFVLSQSSKRVIDLSLYLVDAIAYIQNHAEVLNVDPNNYSLWGTSVGAQVIINVTHHDNKGNLAGKLKVRSTMNVLLYPISYYATKRDVPTVIVVGQQDKIVNQSVLHSAIANLEELQIPAMHIVLPGLAHGFGLGPDINVDQEGVSWVKKVLKFWKDNTHEAIIAKFNKGN